MTEPRVIAEIRLVHPELVLAPTIERVPGVVSELESQTIVPPDVHYLFFEVSGEDLDAFDAALPDDPTVSEPTVIVDAPGFRVYRMRLTSDERLVLPKAADLGMRVLHATSGEGGWLATLEVPELTDLRRFREYCADRDVTVTVRRLYHADDPPGSELGLTDVQRETLGVAYEQGYFDEPRGTTVEELATRLGVSSSAVSGRLRRGIRTLVEGTLFR